VDTTCHSNSDCPAGQTCDTSTNLCGGQVGDTCTQDTDCSAGNNAVCLTATDEFPGGYCTASCNAIGGQHGCPNGYHCVEGILDNNQNQLTCLAVCNSPADCRFDYQCVPVTNGNVCVPPCNVDPSACGNNQRCDNQTGVCQGGGVTNGLNLDAGM
jgi:Cys-rich repeat protein